MGTFEDLDNFIKMYLRMDSLAYNISDKRLYLTDAKTARQKVLFLKGEIPLTIDRYIKALEKEICSCENQLLYYLDFSYTFKEISKAIPLKYRFRTALMFILGEMGDGLEIEEAVKKWAVNEEKFKSDNLVIESLKDAQHREDILIPLREREGDNDIEQYVFWQEEETKPSGHENSISIKKLLSEQRGTK